MTSAPRIYYLFDDLPDDAADGTPARDDLLAPQLAACAALGFTHVMLPAPAIDADASAVAAWVGAARTAGLQLLLDVLVAAPQAQPGHAAAEQDAPPDPRRLGLPVALTLASASASTSTVTATTAQLLQERCTAWCESGVAGFNCRGLTARPADFWRDLIGSVRHRHPETLFIAWTPGCSPQQLKPLAGAGFDATVASSAWWDGRAPWLAEESARLARIAPPIGLVDDPFSPVSAGLCGDEDGDAWRRRCERLLGVAAASGAGLLMPMGFEHGLSGMLAQRGGERLGAQSAAQATRCDLSPAVAAANRLSATLAAADPRGSNDSNGLVTNLGMSQSGATVLLRSLAAGKAATGGTGTQAILLVTNPDSRQPMQAQLDAAVRQLGGLQLQERMWPPAGPESTPPPDAAPSTQALVLAPGAMQILAVSGQPPVVHFVNRGKRSADAACKAPRVAIERITPGVDGGRFPVKRTVGERVDVEADVFMDGHDKLGVMLLWRPSDLAGWQEVRMTPLGNDRWRAALPLQRVGRHVFVVQAWRDAFATYRDELAKKSTAGLDVTLELEEGRRMIAAAAAHAAATGLESVAAMLDTLAARLAPPAAAAPKVAATTAARKGKAKAAASAAVPDAAAAPSSAADPALSTAEAAAQWRLQRVAEVLSDDIAHAMQQADARPFAVQSEPVQAIDAERLAAGFSSWYELFPRSQSGDAHRHGTFADVEKRLPAIRDMGFDTLYFPPIHPIGKRNRKGRNNTLTPAADDPGSPYAIGSDDGGHDATHPELGSLADFRHLVAAAKAHGLEIALDFAIQCSPDHPWIKAHPDWFAWRPDGSMCYAENPPKKYEDIVNVDFYAAGAMPSLWIALRDAVLFWVNEGVRLFRVDNPHTKPLPFWEWMIGDVRSRYPDVVFLSEAFTRPKVMYRLAKVGFSQSYSYFTWRHTKQEFIDYMTELSTTEVQDFFRPHFFVNTPDINPVFLQRSGRPGFLIRAALATMLSGLWGMYSGFELCEATPVPGKEDYLDSEKYEIRAWDWQRPGNIIAEITALNRIRSAHPALQSHLGITFCDSSDPNMLCFLRHERQTAGTTHLGQDVIFVAINLDPFAAHETTFSLPLWQLGLPDHGMLDVDDLVHGNRFTLQGKTHSLRLDPGGLPYAIWRLAPHGDTE